MTSHLLLTFRGTIRRGHNDDAVQKQILKELLEKHGIGDIRDLNVCYEKQTLGEQ